MARWTPSVPALTPIEVDTVNLSNGQLAPFVTGLSTSKGLLFINGGDREAGHAGRTHGRGHGGRDRARSRR